MLRNFRDNTEKLKGVYRQFFKAQVVLWPLLALIFLLLGAIINAYAYYSQRNEEQTKTLKAINQRVIQLEKTVKDEDEARKRRDKEIEDKLQTRLIVRARLASVPFQPSRPDTSQPLGSHLDWTRAAGIADSNFTYVDYIVSHESGWNPNSVNAYSGACSLAQALPCSKISGDWTNPVNALQWMNNYVLARYGSWYGAYLFWQSHNWY